jgi:ubiquinone/menaquinone biosynthesis C-methylase UbiE
MIGAMNAPSSSAPKGQTPRAFWDENQPGFRFASAGVGTKEFFDEVEAHRYSLEPHIPDVVDFEGWTAHDVLEAGCGIATDGIRFARAGARYVGVDLSGTALELARRRFQLEGQGGRFVQSSLLEMPFPDESFDLVYSHGVIHHIADTQLCVNEFRRVLRPGGTALVMLYHRDSANYRFTIMTLRRALSVFLLLPGGVATIAKLTGENPALLRAHRRLLEQHGLGYLTDQRLFLSKNTDGPANPLSKVYSRREAAQLFQGFHDLRFQTRYLNLRAYPGGHRFARTKLGRRLERRFGWHLYVEARKSVVQPSHAE